MRRFAQAVVALALVAISAGCLEEMPASPKSDMFWSTVPETDEQRWEVLRRVRAVDPCALIPRADLSRFGSVVRVEARRPEWCSTVMEATGRTKIDWSLLFAPNGLHIGEGARATTVGAAKVTMLADVDADPSKKDELVERKCTATVTLPSTAAVMLFVTTPLGTEPCSVVEEVVPALLANLNRSPGQGTSPDTPKTVLHGTDPCRVARGLGATPSIEAQQVWKCIFTYRGDTVLVEYTYDQEKLFAEGEPLIVNGRRVYRKDLDEARASTALVGPEIFTAEPAFMGPRFPVVTVLGKDAATVEEVVRQVASYFPAA